MVVEHRSHAEGLLCEVGRNAYLRALQENRVRTQEANGIPCLADLDLLRPDPEDPLWLRPVAPSVALPQLLHRMEECVAQQRLRGARMAAAFESLMPLARSEGPSSSSSFMRVLDGVHQIMPAIGLAARSSQEILVIQPGGKRPAENISRGLPIEQGVLDRGGRIRTLYQHTTRHSPPALAHYEQLDGDVEVRTLDELPKRLILFDRAYAFIPASKNRDDVALELRQPDIINYLATTFEILWRLGTPMFPTAEPLPTTNGITPRQQAIAALLTEGLTDADIAARLGMNVRTARVHIAKLSAVLNSTSRAQLGYLIGKSGILDRASG
ncbi:helix-turn-helix transcriptional regulator [Streptomyces alboflavus]|uniref:helix-turn-helix transcriptional regulator n=1 Tax=Streptomyces alboflavus TaxID=67267 RepID=UPI000B42CCE0|nr:LuxR C-terminal-related transcriptional regulator [Streptomyces alboflavus]